MASRRKSYSISETKFSDNTLYIINNILDKSNTKYTSQRFFNNTNKNTYYVDSKSLEGIIYTLKTNLPKKSFFRSIRNSLSSIRKTLTKKKSSRNNKLSSITNTNTNTNSNKNSEPLIDFKSLISRIEELLSDKKGTTIDKKIIDSYLNILAKYMNNPKCFNKTKFNSKKIKFIFIDKEKQLEIERKVGEINDARKVSSLNIKSMTQDLEILQSQEEKSKKETNKKAALSLVKSLNVYFESLGDKDYDTIIKDLDIYIIQYQTFKSLLNGQLEPGESEEQLHRLYYELLYNMNKNNTKKLKDIKKINEINEIIDLILNIRLQLLKVKGGVYLTEKELNERFKLLKGTPMTEKELNEKFDALKKH